MTTARSLLISFGIYFTRLTVIGSMVSAAGAVADAPGPSWMIYRNPAYQNWELQRPGSGQIIDQVEIDIKNSSLRLFSQSQTGQTESLDVRFSNVKNAVHTWARLTKALSQQSGLSIDLSHCVEAVPLYETYEFRYSPEMSQEVSCRRVHHGFIVKCDKAWWASTPLIQVEQSDMRIESPHSGSVDFLTTLECPNPDEENYRHWGMQHI